MRISFLTKIGWSRQTARNGCQVQPEDIFWQNHRGNVELVVVTDRNSSRRPTKRVTFSLEDLAVLKAAIERGPQ